MNNKLSYLIHWILIAGLTLALCFSVIRSHRSSTSENVSSFESKTDTLSLSDRFLIDTDLKFDEKPKTVYLWFTDTLISEKLIEKISVVRDTVTLTLRDSSKLDFNSGFLTQYPKNPKLLQADISNSSFRLSLLSTEGKTYTEEFEIDPRFRNYRYTDHLSSKRINFWKRFEPFTQLTVKPFHSMLDLDFGVTYKTRKINYEIGISGFYYPQFQNPFGGDLFLRVRYHF